MLDTADDGFNHQMGMDGQRPGMFSDLQGQFASWCQNQYPCRTSSAPREIEEMLHGRQQKCGCFTGSCRRGSKNVTSVHRGWDHLLLDGGRTDKALLGDGAQQDGVKVEGIEGHEGGCSLTYLGRHYRVVA